MASTLASTNTEEYEEDVVEDEIWENQRREGSSGIWLPATDRGRFSDRFGRFKYNQLSDVPVPKDSRVVEDFQEASLWIHAKSFTTLESELAKGTHRHKTAKWNYSVRWRRWVRKRVPSKDISNEIISGWLGSKDRRGAWKSRYFILMGGASGSPSAPPGADETDDDSSNDEAGEDDADQGKEEEEIGSPGVPTHRDPLAAETQAPMLFYLRRGFTDPRAAFPLAFDSAEIRKLPKKMVRTLPLTSKVKIDDSLSSSDYPGRFAIRYPSGYKRVFNAASSEVRERWVEALRSLIEDNHEFNSSPTSRRRGRLVAAFRAAKRGQLELRKGFTTLRRSSQSGSSAVAMSVIASSHPPLASPALLHVSSSPSLIPANEQILLPVTLPPSSVVELMRSDVNGTLSLRLIEQVSGKGLIVDAIYETARDLNGNFPSSINIGDNVIAIQGESLLGLEKPNALRKLKEVLARFPKGEKVSLNIIQVPPSLVRRTSSHKEPPSPTPGKRELKSIYSSGHDTVDENGKEESESFKTVSMVKEKSPSNNSIPSTEGTNGGSPGSPMIGHVQIASRTRNSVRSKVVDIPPNEYGIDSPSVRALTLQCLDRLSENGPVTYARLRSEVGIEMQKQKNLLSAINMETDEWRIWFRDFLDYWVCDGIRYVVGGLDLNDFTPVIQRTIDNNTD